jgi:hypothetical protein
MKQLTIINEPATLHKGFVRVGIDLGYGYADKIFDENGNKTYPLNSNTWAKSWGATLDLQMGITDRLQILVSIPYSYMAYYYSSRLEVPARDSIANSSWNLNGSGLSDIETGINYQILTEQDGRPAMVGKLSIDWPTGEKNPTKVNSKYDFKLPVGYGAMVVNAGIILRKIHLPYSYIFYANYNYKFSGSKIIQPGGDAVSFQDGSFLNTGGSFNFHLNDWITLQNDLGFYYRFEDKIASQLQGNSSWTIQYQPIVTFQIKRFRLVETIQLPITGKMASADPQFIMILQYII